MRNKENMPPTFKNDYDALVFLIGNYGFKGGWIGAGGMGPEIGVDIQKTTPKWVKSIAVDFVFALHSSSHPALNMAVEVADSGKTRGHLGSQLERKAETNLRLGKANGVSTVYTDRGARHCDIPRDFGTSFQYSAEDQRHVLVASKKDAQAKDKRADLVAFASSVFESSSGRLSWAELRNHIKEMGGYADSTARKHIENMTNLGIVTKDDSHRYAFAG